MRNVKMTDVISRSIGRTSAILFKPFILKKWLVLVFIGLFAGAISLGNGRGNGGGSNHSTTAPKAGVQATSSQGTASVAGTSSTTGSASVSRAPASPQEIFDSIKKALQSKAVLAIAISVIIFIIIFSMLWTWVMSRFLFVWFDAIATNNASIIEPFHRHKTQGRSLFVAYLVISVISLAFISVLIGWGLFNASQAGAFASGFAWSIPVFFHIFAAPLSILLIYALVSILLSVAIINFVVMIMAVDGIGFMAALKKTAGIYKNNLGDIILFHFVLLGLAIACGILALLAGIVFVLVVLLLGLIIFGGGYALIVAAMKLNIFFIIYCIVLGVPSLIIALIALLCIQLPFSVFLRSFSIEYLCSLDCGYTYERLAEYGKVRSENKSRSAIVVPVVLVCILMLVFIIGLLAAIAIPNFIKAREAAKAMVSTQKQGNLSSSYR